MPTPTDIPLSTYQVSNAQYSQSEIILTQAFKASHWNCLVMYLSTICLIDKLTYLFPFLILFSTFFSPFSLFLVACTRLYKSLSVGLSVRLSVGPSLTFSKIMNKRLSEKAENICRGREFILNIKIIIITVIIIMGIGEQHEQGRPK